MTICGGVLVADGTRHCFIEERGLGTRAFSTEERRLRASVDHFVPRSLAYTFGLDGYAAAITHKVHEYCQWVQGGLIPKSLLTRFRIKAYANTAEGRRIRSEGGTRGGFASRPSEKGLERIKASHRGKPISAEHAQALHDGARRRWATYRREKGGEA